MQRSLESKVPKVVLEWSVYISLVYFVCDKFRFSFPWEVISILDLRRFEVGDLLRFTHFQVWVDSLAIPCGVIRVENTEVFFIGVS